MRNALIVLILLSCSVYKPVIAQPYRPASDAEILEILPAQGKNWLEIRSLRQNLAANPNDLKQALILIKRYIELGRAESDPRYYGYAEAALSPWVKVTQPAAEVLTLQATLYQNRHEFSQALNLLNAALKQQPRSAQAWLTRALIQEVQGQYPAALDSCKPLLRLAAPLTAAVCINSVRSLSGELDSAYQNLRQTVQFMPIDNPIDKQWALNTLAEMAERKGDSASAEQHYQEALAAAGRNGYLLATYADFLLDQNRFDEVIRLLQNEIRHDGLLLRLTLAEQGLHSANASLHTDMLKARFAASRMRGDTSHQGDEARFTLQLLQAPRQALDLAQQNWAVQREPRDARILLEAVLADRKSLAVAQATLDYLAQIRLQDARLQILVDQLKGANS